MNQQPHTTLPKSADREIARLANELIAEIGRYMLERGDGAFAVTVMRHDVVGLVAEYYPTAFRALSR
jgi:hypothetical protein